MTREEAITYLQEKYDYCKSFYDLAAHPEEVYPEMTKYLQALQIALSALRPVSREQVEKVWRGKWELYGGEKNGRGGIWHCTRCEKNYPYKNDFCPHCGAPMTDEAVEMVMERMEALHDTSN